MRKILFLLLLLSGLNTRAQVRYTLSMPNPQTHYFEVEMEWTRKSGKMPCQVKMPVWAPGSYLVREFARFVENVQASSEGKNLSVEKVNKNTWQIDAGTAKKIKLSYRVYAFELSVRSSFLDTKHGYINGTSVFMFPAEQQNEPISLKIEPYSGFSKVSTALEKVKELEYKADNYDILADSPIEIGNHKTFQFVAEGVVHEFAMYGDPVYDESRIKKDVSKIIREAVRVFGEHPCRYYLFIVHHMPNGGGGLEHLNSTTLQTDLWTYTNENEYKGFLGLVAHEYFHLWNVKRLRPLALGPFDYDNENYTHGLWISEGFTSYYDNLLLLRAGLMSETAMLQTCVSDATYIVNLPGDKVQSVAESSWDAWIKFYRSTENSQNNGVSYYTKGGYLAFLLDVEIMEATKGEKNLSHLMRAMYEKYYKGLKRGFKDEEFEAEASKVAGKDLSFFFKKYVFGTDSIPAPSYFERAGVELKNINLNSKEAYLGIQTSSRSGKQVITTVKRGSTAWDNGLNVNDEIIAVNGLRSLDINSEVSNRYAPGDTITVSVMREDRLISLKIPLWRNDLIRYSGKKMEKQTELQKQVWSSWMRVYE